MYQSEYFGAFEFQLWEFLLLPIVVAILLFSASYTQTKKELKNPAYKYYTRGLLVKLISSVVFCLIYVYYYKGGDTMSYYDSAVSMRNLFLQKPGHFLEVLFLDNTRERIYYFDSTTGYPYGYMYFDDQTFTVIRIITPLVIITNKSYLLSSVLLARLSYSGIWKLYILFSTYFPPVRKHLAWGILFVPSVVFWGSGILKDTITLASACWFVYAFNQGFIFKRKRVRNIFIMFLAGATILVIKPYILMVLLPGTVIWALYSRLSKIRSKVALFILFPGIVVASIGVGIFFMSTLGERLAKFSPDKILQTAAVTQQDLKQEYYSKNSFDIGEFDPSVAGIITKAPVAIFFGLFRPFLWDSSNVVMLLSGLENFIILFITVMLFIKIKIKRFMTILFENPLLIFSLVYSILFSFSVGLTTANFGALVRFKIPFLPFYIATLVVLYYFMKNRKITNVRDKMTLVK